MDKNQLLDMVHELNEKKRTVVREIICKTKNYMIENGADRFETQHLMYNGNNWYVVRFDSEWEKDVWILQDAKEVILQYAEEIIEKIG